MKKIIINFKQYKVCYLSALIMVLAATTLILSVPFLQYIGRNTIDINTLDALDLDKYNKLMIVAHPDDEMLWGGAELISDDYLIVCVTNGNNVRRSSEFEKVVTATNDIGIILSYPDKINGIRSDWSFCKDSIMNDLTMIINYKNWKKIVTHNEKGEYGHIHHIMTHELVDTICDSNNLSDKEYYFGTYYKKSMLNKNPSKYSKTLSGDLLMKKEAILTIYKSQQNTVNKLGHMIPYENIVKRQNTP